MIAAVLAVVIVNLFTSLYFQKVRENKLTDKVEMYENTVAVMRDEMYKLAMLNRQQRDMNLQKREYEQNENSNT